MLKILGLLSVLALTFSNVASAGKAFSWNLSRAMMIGIVDNPIGKGAWAFMQNTSGIDNPANYTFLPKYSSSCFGRGALNCWINTRIVQPPIIGVATKTYKYRGITLVRGIPYLHPGDNIPTILRWKSPVNGAVSVMGGVSAIDPNCCGDGINWSLKNKNATVITSGYLAQGQGSTFLVQNIEIKKGESLYFSVDMNHAVYNDSVNLDMIITSQQ